MTHLHEPGDLLANRYEVLEYLNEGGMQEVYVAQDHTLGRRVALKVPKNSSAARRFDRSAVLSAKVVHPNIAATLDYFEDGDRSYLVEELILGDDLKTHFDSRFLYMDPHLAAHTFSHLVRGVAAAHHAGVWHRDLKPSNIIVSDDPGLGTIKITDFGIAKMAEEELADGVDKWEKDESSITGSKTLVGAIPYMAPEQFTAPRDASLASDVWALGAILYSLVAGDPPFGRGAPAIAKIITYTGTELKPPPLFGRKAAFRALEDELLGIIQACLQKDPGTRPTADELVTRCSGLCYSTAPRVIGEVVEFGNKSGDWGTIRLGNGSVFLHSSVYYSGSKPVVGTKVCFAYHEGDPWDRASPALPLR